MLVVHELVYYHPQSHRIRKQQRLLELLFPFAVHCLWTPTSLASQVNADIREESDHQQPLSINRCPPHSGDPGGCKPSWESNNKVALWITSSVESFAPVNVETLATTWLRIQTPICHQNSWQTNHHFCRCPVRRSRAITTFPCDLVRGPDGLQPQHLKDLISGSAVSHTPHFLRAITAFIDLLLKERPHILHTLS